MPDSLSPSAPAAAKRERLDALLSSLPRPLVALSGGADSALVAARAAAAGLGAAAATLSGPLFCAEETERAAAVARFLGLPHHLAPLDALAIPEVRANPPDRCYHCKRAGMGLLHDLAHRMGHGAVLDGQNADDDRDWRPGSRAAAELGVRSPLKEAGLGKEDIHAWSRELGLPTAGLEASACLASRIPHGTALTAAALGRVAAAESALRHMGFRRVRVRHEGETARIEVDPGQVAELARLPARAEAARAMKALGFRNAALDLEGYRTGSLNPVWAIEGTT